MAWVICQAMFLMDVKEIAVLPYLSPQGALGGSIRTIIMEPHGGGLTLPIVTAAAKRLAAGSLPTAGRAAESLVAPRHPPTGGGGAKWDTRPETSLAYRQRQVRR